MVTGLDIARPHRLACWIRGISEVGRDCRAASGIDVNHVRRSVYAHHPSAYAANTGRRRAGLLSALHHLDRSSANLGTVRRHAALRLDPDAIANLEVRNAI